MSRKRDTIKRYEVLIKALLKISKFFPKKVYLKLFKLIRSHDNQLAMLFRYICLKNCAKSCGDNIAVFSNVYLFNIEKLEIGSNVSIHPMCYINASGGVIIKDNVSIAHNSTIMSEEHIYSDLETNIKDQGHVFKKTIIHSNVWIAAGCRILAGSVINSGSIIAAGAVVTKEVPTNVIVGGIPAKKIKER